MEYPLSFVFVLVVSLKRGSCCALIFHISSRQFLVSPQSSYNLIALVVMFSVNTKVLSRGKHREVSRGFRIFMFWNALVAWKSERISRRSIFETISYRCLLWKAGDGYVCHSVFVFSKSVYARGSLFGAGHLCRARLIIFVPGLVLSTCAKWQHSSRANGVERIILCAFGSRKMLKGRMEEPARRGGRYSIGDL